MRKDILVLGGGPVGRALAARLQANDRTVAFVDDDDRTLERARGDGLDAYESTLESATTPFDLSARTTVVATASDARNLLLAGGAPGAFETDRVVALLNDPHNRPAFDDADVETVHVPETLARAASGHIVDEGSTATDDEPVDRARVYE